MSIEESLKLFLGVHFPWKQSTKELHFGGLEERCTAFSDLLDEHHLTWALNSLKAVPGPDDIILAQFQQTVKVSWSWLASIYANCVRLRHVLEAWRQVIVVFISETGRRFHIIVEDFKSL